MNRRTYDCQKKTHENMGDTYIRIETQTLRNKFHKLRGNRDSIDFATEMVKLGLKVYEEEQKKKKK